MGRRTMPSGKVHSAVTTVLSIAGPAIFYYYFGFPVREMLLTGAGGLSGLFLTPDLDVDSGSVSQSNVRRAGGGLLGAAWTVLWKPYALLIRHRSFLSHGPIIGTVIRLLYVVFVPWLVWLLLSRLVSWVPSPYQVAAVPAWFWWFAAGLAVVDCAHIFLDWLMTRLLRRR